MKMHLRLLAFVAVVSATVFSLRAAEQPAAPAAPAVPGYVPCKIVSQARGVYPLRLLFDGVTHGEAHVVLEVGLDGRLTDSLLTAYTHREFADETLRVVGESRYSPGTIDGQPVISILNLQLRFETTGVVVYQRFGVPSRLVEMVDGHFEYRPHGLATIDRPPAGRHLPGPIYPKEWIEEGRTGNVTVDFYIDETGQARMPVALGSPDELLATAAVVAVKQWRFEPPRRRGKPVLAHAQQVFVFKPEPKAPPRPDT
jgi:TonB family protein